MWPASYWPATYWSASYWPKTGQTASAFAPDVELTVQINRSPSLLVAIARTANVTLNINRTVSLTSDTTGS